MGPGLCHLAMQGSMLWFAVSYTFTFRLSVPSGAGAMNILLWSNRGHCIAGRQPLLLSFATVHAQDLCCIT